MLLIYMSLRMAYLQVATCRRTKHTDLLSM